IRFSQKADIRRCEWHVRFGPMADIRALDDWLCPSLSFREEPRRARQNHSDFSELAGLRIDFFKPTMLLNDDVVTDGEAKAGPFSCGFRREEGVEHLLFHLG